jgi:hypothetical protein
MKARHALVAALLLGCGAPGGPTPETLLEVHAVPTVVPRCDARVTSWKVNVRETGEHYTRACEQVIVLGVLQPYVRYTLELSASTHEGVCWSGTCTVTPAPGLAIAECPSALTEVCE